MNFGEWKVRINPAFYDPVAPYQVFLYRDTRGGREVITHKGEYVHLKEGELPTPPVLADDGLWFARMDDEQLQAFADALSEFGKKTRNDHKNEGLLEATKAHLDDMRTLVFDKKKGK